MGLTYTNSIVNLYLFIYLKKIIRNYVLHFFTDYKLLTIHSNIVNILETEQVELVENLHPNFLPYRFLHNLQPFFYGKTIFFFQKKK